MGLRYFICNKVIKQRGSARHIFIQSVTRISGGWLRAGTDPAGELKVMRRRETFIGNLARFCCSQVEAE
jgi:hypothetical protein